MTQTTWEIFQWGSEYWFSTWIEFGSDLGWSAFLTINSWLTPFDTVLQFWTGFSVQQSTSPANRLVRLGRKWLCKIKIGPGSKIVLANDLLKCDFSQQFEIWIIVLCPLTTCAMYFVGKTMRKGLYHRSIRFICYHVQAGTRVGL